MSLDEEGQPEPTLVTCPYCLGMHPPKFIEQCPLKEPSDVRRFDYAMEAVGRSYGRQWRQEMYGEFLPIVSSGYRRRMDEQATMGILALRQGLAALSALQSSYATYHGKSVLIPGNPLELSGEYNAIENVVARLQALIDVGHHE